MKTSDTNKLNNLCESATMLLINLKAMKIICINKKKMLP